MELLLSLHDGRVSPEPKHSITEAAELSFLKGCSFPSRESVRSIFMHAFQNFPTGFVFTHDTTAMRRDENFG